MYLMNPVITDCTDLGVDAAELLFQGVQLALHVPLLTQQLVALLLYASDLSFQRPHL